MCVTASYASRVSGAAAVAFSLLLSSGRGRASASKVTHLRRPPASRGNELPGTAPRLSATAGRLRATQLAIEQNRLETKAAAIQNAEALSKGLQAIQQAFAAQRAQDLEAMQRSNKVMLIVVGIFGAMVF